MRAVIIATGEAPEIKPLGDRHPVPLLPLVDRPLLQHLVEYYTPRGVTQFHFVLHYSPDKIEHHLGDGSRWGSRFSYHLARDPLRPYRALKVLDWGGENSPILFGHADRLPLLSLPDVEPLPTRPILFSYREPVDAEEELHRHWTGWALVLPEHLETMPTNADEEELCAHLLKAAGDGQPWFDVPLSLRMKTVDEVLWSHRAILGKETTGLSLGCREADPGIWLGRNVRLHPTAQLLPPAYIGENCDIGLGVKVGPYAMVGRDSVLDAHALVMNSVIFPGSYIGEGLNVADVIVDRNRLINPRVGGAVIVNDNFLLASMYERHLSGWLRRFFSRAAGLAALLLALPVLLVTALWLMVFRRGPVLFRKEAVRVPAILEEDTWQTFRLWSFLPPAQGHEGPTLHHLLLRFLPALFNVARGDLSFVGVPARNPAEVQALAHDWQLLYLNSRVGIVTEAALRFSGNITEDELYSADAFYAATANWKYDLGLLARYVVRALFGWKRLSPQSIEK